MGRKQHIGGRPIKHHAIFALMLAVGAVCAAPAVAQAPPTAAAPQSAIAVRADEVVALLNGKVAPNDVFSASFLAAVPPAQIKALSANLTAQLGAAVEVALLNPRDGIRAALEIRFERGLAKGGIAIDPAQEGRISELVFTAVDALAVAGDTPAAIAADLAALPGTVNAVFAPLNGGAPIISVGADTRLALGSAFKLYVLAALGEDVKAGRRRWTDVVALTEKSYPSGQLQDWPQGAPVTLHTLASMMISISDNTATDQLIAELGQPRILQVMRDSGHADPGANGVFLKTRELFVLKASDPAILQAWRARDGAGKVAILLAEVAHSKPALETINAAFAGGPKALDIEWFASPADLAKLLAHMRAVADPAVFDILAINPSATPAIQANWDYIGYKGGSEPGVLNLTWLLRDTAGRDYILTLGWNNPAAALDDGKLLAIARRILLLPH